MILLNGTVLKADTFTSKKGKEMTGLTLFGQDKEVYQALAEFKTVARVSEGEVISLIVRPLPSAKGITYFVNGIHE